MKPLFSERVIMDYEVKASWWADKISWGWAQDIAASYFAWKVRRKWNRWHLANMRELHLKELSK